MAFWSRSTGRLTGSEKETTTMPLETRVRISVPVPGLYLGGREGLGLGHRSAQREKAEALSQAHEDAEGGHPEHGRSGALGCPPLPGRPALFGTDHDRSFTLG